MSPELSTYLIEKYPKIFPVTTSLRTSLMGFGFQFDDGWFDIIDRLCSKIQKHIDEKGGQQVIAIEAKEKFGGLRFYVDQADDFVYNLIDKAEEESERVCEVCGEDGKLRDGSWYRTLCDYHAEKHA